MRCAEDGKRKAWGHCRPGRPPRHHLGGFRPVSGLTSGLFRDLRLPVPKHSGVEQISDSFTVAGAAPGLFAVKTDFGERTGFPFHFPERQFRETPEADELQTPAHYR